MKVPIFILIFDIGTVRPRFSMHSEAKIIERKT
jgi:hypothetical protein